MHPGALERACQAASRSGAVRLKAFKVFSGWGYIGIMEKKMETTGITGIMPKDDGKDDHPSPARQQWTLGPTPWLEPTVSMLLRLPNLFSAFDQLWVFQNWGYHLGGPHNKDYISGPILGSPYFGKLPFMFGSYLRRFGDRRLLAGVLLAVGAAMP